MALTSCVHAKVVIIGDQGVGKTSFLRQHLEQKFYPIMSPTIGVSYFNSIVNTGECYSAKLQIWDTAGQERYRCLVSSFYRKANIALFMFDITDHYTFRNISSWLDDLKYNLVDENICYYLIGNKNDLERKREVSAMEAREYSQTINAKYFECSSTKFESVEKIFAQAAEDAIKIHAMTIPSSANESVQEVSFSAKLAMKKKKCCKS